MFDNARAMYAVNFIQSLKHTKGKWAGKPFELLPWQYEVIKDVYGTLDENGRRQYQFVYLEIPKKNGKQLALDTPMPTPDGWSTMGAIRVGDRLFDENGKPCRVVAKSAVDDTEQAYRLTFEDGSTIVAGANHLWDCDQAIDEDGRCILKTSELYRKHRKINEMWAGTADCGLSAVRIRVSGSLQTVPAVLPLEPYTYGYRLANSHEKVIRKEYLRASEPQRRSLLQGLMDGKWGAGKVRNAYRCTSEELALGVRELLWSLGIKNTMAAEARGANEVRYTIQFTSDGEPSGYHFVKSIEPLDYRVKMQCVQVDSASHCYLAGTAMVPTHNSELGAAVALYHTFADGEVNGEIYSCASDRAQASLVFDVAEDMVKQSPALSRRTKATTSLKVLTDTVSGSQYKVVSAEAFSKHGLNISCCIFDELHAQPTRDLWDVMTSGSGDAREEPLWFVITTAGDDVNRNSIGWEIHEKAKQIISGEIEDPRWYCKIWGVPDDYDGDIWDEKLWYEVNPSLGHTIDVDKVRLQALSAKNNPAEERNFRWLRLNQWVSVKRVGWLPVTLWDTTTGKWSETELLGRDCYVGVDLSTTTDLTALALLFPPGDGEKEWRFKLHSFIPKDNMVEREQRDKVPFSKWLENGYVHATPGDVVDYRYIARTIEQICGLYNVRYFCADKWRLEYLRQLLPESIQGQFIEIPQTMAGLSVGMQELERMFRAGEISHLANPLGRWAFGNVRVATDGNENIKPMKSKAIERIDPIVALINAMSGAIKLEPQKSVYETRGIRVV